MPIRLTVIGGGPGGYTAAFAAARAGMSVTLVESGNLGGTCLNNGCIPTKTLFQSAEVANTVRESARYGIGSALTGVDSLGYLPLETLCEMTGSGSYCASCFDGKYPTKVPTDVRKDRFERKLSEKN